MIGVYIFVAVFFVTIPTCLFSPQPLDKLNINLNLNESPKGGAKRGEVGAGEGKNVDILWEFGMKKAKVSICTGDSITWYWFIHHNVQPITEDVWDDENCEHAGMVDTPETGPFLMSFPTAGTYYFACGVGKDGIAVHCKNGMKSKITV